MENSVQKSQDFFDLEPNFLKKKLFNIVESEICKKVTDIDTRKMNLSIKTLDYIDGLQSIPEEFSLENFAIRFNALHNMNLLHNEEKK